jgi:transposase
MSGLEWSSVICRKAAPARPASTIAASLAASCTYRVPAAAEAAARPNTAYPPPSVGAQGVWNRLFARLAAAGNIPDEISIDSTHVKAHRSAAGARKGAMRHRRSAAHRFHCSLLQWVPCVAGGPARSTLWPMLKANLQRRPGFRPASNQAAKCCPPRVWQSAAGTG